MAAYNGSRSSRPERRAFSGERAFSESEERAFSESEERAFSESEERAFSEKEERAFSEKEERAFSEKEEKAFSERRAAAIVSGELLLENTVLIVVFTLLIRKSGCRGTQL